jgi:hypothetical protein
MSDRLSSPLLDAVAERVAARGAGVLLVKSAVIVRENPEGANPVRAATDRDHPIVAAGIVDVGHLGRRRGRESAKLGYRGVRSSAGNGACPDLGDLALAFPLFEATRHRGEYRD